MPDNRRTIRNIDPDLLTEARILAIQLGTNLGTLISEGLELVLSEYDQEEEDAERNRNG